MSINNKAERLSYILRGKNRCEIYQILLTGPRTQSEISQKTGIPASSVSLYGLELYDLVAQCVPESKNAFENLQINFIIGPHASYYSLKQYEDLNVSIYRNLNSPFPFFRASDVIISQAGYQSLMEIIKSETAAIFFPRTSEQKLNLKRYSFPWFRTLHNFDPKELLNHIYDVSTVTQRPDLEMTSGADNAAHQISQLLKLE